MKILNLRDTHFRAKNSANRIGNMYEDILCKLDEVIELSKGCDIVLHDGDFYDTPYVSNVVIDDIIDRIESAKIPWYVTPGNHDMTGANWNASKSSALAHTFRRSEYITELKGTVKVKKEKVLISPYPYYFGIEEEIKKIGLKTKYPEFFTIASTHAFISIKPFLSQVSHIQAKDIDTNYDLVTCSHFHDVFNEVYNGTRFINTGSLVRLSITERKHQPKVAIIDTETKEVEFITLKSTKKPEEIFDFDKIDEKKEFTRGMEDFIKSIESVQFQEMSITGMISKIAKEQSVDKKVTDLIFEKIGEINE